MEVIKRLRQQQIRDLVATRNIRTQHELAAALRERGYRATQATISRDVSEMGLIKQTREGTRGYEVPATRRTARDERRGATGHDPARPADRGAARRLDDRRQGSARFRARGRGRA